MNDYENVVDFLTPAQRDQLAQTEAEHQRVVTLMQARADGWRGELTDYLSRTDPKRLEPKAEHMREPVDRVLSRYLEPKGGGKPETISTGFDDLDTLMTLEPESLVVVGARSSRGKSCLALQLAMNVGMFSGYASTFFATEMSSEQMALRAACVLASVDSKRIRRGEATENDRHLLATARGRIAKALSWISDENGLDVLRVRERARSDMRRIRDECGKAVKVIVVDYLQRIKAGKAAVGGANREQQIAAIAYELKEMARELKVCVVVPAQLNADGDKRGEGGEARPRASDLRESKSIESEADVVLLIHNPHYLEREADPRHDMSKREACELIVAKGRNDGTGSVPIWFTPMFTRFSTMTEEDKYERLKRQVPR